jgi:hypothetical protein
MLMVEHTQHPPRKAQLTVGQKCYTTPIRVVSAVEHLGQSRITVCR